LGFFTFGTLFVSNMAFALFRSRAVPIPTQVPMTPQPMATPYYGSPYAPQPSPNHFEQFYVPNMNMIGGTSPKTRSVRKGPVARVLHGWSPASGRRRTKSRRESVQEESFELE
jgi:hypothetical protein